MANQSMMNYFCELCMTNAGAANSILYFAEAEIWACAVCTQCRLGYSIAYPDEEKFEHLCINKRIGLPGINKDGLYSLGAPSRIHFNFKSFDLSQPYHTIPL
ncbi:hypothetical protein [uncultured Tateyamaria sp.]|uniref:hypothetical protein n=1 Tax=uncultured Tateyamaria sp. TaxID=455651 RepID=UPI002628D647|nr:hypothetical protein [uncultured Tateyamaria sp.]